MRLDTYAGRVRCNFHTASLQDSSVYLSLFYHLPKRCILYVPYMEYKLQNIFSVSMEYFYVIATPNWISCTPEA